MSRARTLSSGNVQCPQSGSSKKALARHAATAGTSPDVAVRLMPANLLSAAPGIKPGTVRPPRCSRRNLRSMAEVLPDMPAGTLGFRISGKLTREDYVEVLVPPLRRAVKEGTRLRVLYAIGPELHMEPGALWQDMKLEIDLGIRNRDAWERIAVVTDLDWLWRAFGLFSWMVPGEMRMFHERELAQAKAWLTEQAA